MALDTDSLAKPFGKLRKSLKKISKQPSPDEVHGLRTRTRRVEAALHALLLDKKGKGKRVLRAVTPVRKRAGKVRDMDVLIGIVSSLNTEPEDACRLQLLEKLSEQRLSGVQKLRKTTAKHRGAARRGLKRFSSSIQKNSSSAKARLEWPSNAAAIALKLSGEIKNWPKLNTRNLHPFRLKLKELRYVLELSGGEEKVADALKDVTDVIGGRYRCDRRMA
jgi:CHAD domain-containing protein